VRFEWDAHAGASSFETHRFAMLLRMRSVLSPRAEIRRLSSW
jgi:hypothetical protein